MLPDILSILPFHYFARNIVSNTLHNINHRKPINQSIIFHIIIDYDAQGDLHGTVNPQTHVCSTSRV